MAGWPWENPVNPDDVKVTAVGEFGAIFYIVLVYLIAPAISPPKSVVSFLMYWHNVALSAFSFASFFSVMYLMVLDGHLVSLSAFLCKPCGSGAHGEIFELLLTCFEYSKVWEWADTLFLIWKAPTNEAGLKKLRMVHVIHHSTTLWVWLLFRIIPGSAKCAITLNSFIHGVMYLHYANPLPRWARPIITTGQLCQFCLGLAVHTMSLIPAISPCADDLLREHWLGVLSPYGHVLSYLGLFINFFNQQYIKPAPGQGSEIAKKGGTGANSRSPSRRKKRN